jgi:TonB-linked SusC/RagA family outer membrane protein
MTVLKDAASASIYGTRAANGVVVITTRKGAAGRSKIEFGYYYGTTSTTKKLDVLDAKQYQQYMNETYGAGTITDSLVNAVNINWPDEVFRNGSQANYQIAVSGGNDKTQHFISLNYNDQVGMIRPSQFNRVTGRINLNSKLNNWFSINTNTMVSRANQYGVTDNASVARGGVVLSALATPPTVPRYNANGTIAQNPLTGWENPLGTIEGVKDKSTNDRLVSNLGADIRLWKGLVLQSRFGIDYQNYLSDNLLDPWLTQDGRNNKGRITERKVTQFVWLTEQTATYTTTIDRNHFTLLGGWSVQDSRWDQTTNGATKIDTQYRHASFSEIYMRAGTKNPPSKLIDEWALTSFFGRISYDFDNKYLLQANIRSDKSSKFAPDNRTATFPSFSAGWRISQEDFFSDVKFIDDLKIRAGWGQNGNQEGIGSYQYLSLSNINPQDGSTTPFSIAPSDLRWETTTQTNIGIDASILNRRISFSADFYIKKTEDVLVNVPLPAQSGFEHVLVNMGTMRNMGTEFVISSRNIVNRSLQWSTDLNISFNKNKVLEIGNGISLMNGYGSIYERGNAVALVQGYGLGTFYGYIADGVDPATGKLLYRTKDGKSVPYTETTPSDRQIIGSAQPDFVYGMTNTLSYNNFTLTVFVQGSQGNKIFNGVRVETEGMKDSRNQSTAVLNRWRNNGDLTAIPGVSPASNDNTQISTRFLEDGSYLRFKTITLLYRFADKLINKIGLGAASIYVSAQNLITITKYKGFDPEVNTYGTAVDGNNRIDTDSRNISLGVDYGAYPQAKVILFGVNVSLK